MTKRDDQLQQYITSLERGATIDEVIRHLSVDEEDLIPLLTLVAGFRALPPPAIDPIAARQQDRVIQAFIRQQAKPQQGAGKIHRPRLTIPRLAIASLGVVAVCLLFVLWAGPWRSGPDVTPGLRVAQIQGTVETSASTAGLWQSINPGDDIRLGQQVRTGADASVVLDLEDGSRIRISPNTQLTLTRLEPAQDGLISIEMTQHSGATHHQVSSRHNSDAVYIVRTPAGVAQVRGTTFSVAVADDEHTFFAVDEGEVAVSVGDSVVALPAGFATSVRGGQAPASPVRAFRVQGVAQQIAAPVWQIDDALVYVTDETVLSADLQEGELVDISGRLLPNGRWQADVVEPVASSDHHVTFTGTLAAMSPAMWLIDEVSVQLDETTLRPDAPAVGDLLRVTYVPLSNGRRLATRIERLGQQVPVVADPAVVPGMGRPSLSFEPDELAAAGCRERFVVDGTLANSGDSPEDTALNVGVEHVVLSGAQFVNRVTVSPASWDSIAVGESVSFSVRVNLNAAWLSARPESEVKIRLFVVPGNDSNLPGFLPARLTITLVQNCDEPTTTPAATSTPLASSTPGNMTPSPVPTQPVTGTPPPTGVGCTGVDPHPEAVRLAGLYKVPVSEITDWFCAGFGFGEIDLVYSLSEQTGVAVEEIFAMRRAGMGWGEIMQQLGVLPGPPPVNTPPGSTPTPPTGPPPSATSTDEPEDDGPPPWVTVSPGPPASVTPGGPPPSVTPGPPATLPVPPVTPEPEPTEVDDEDEGPPLTPPGNPPETPPGGPPETPPGGPPGTPPGGPP